MQFAIISSLVLATVIPSVTAVISDCYEYYLSGTLLTGNCYDYDNAELDETTGRMEAIWTSTSINLNHCISYAMLTLYRNAAGGYATHCTDCFLDGSDQAQLTCQCNDEVTGLPEDEYVYYDLSQAVGVYSNGQFYC